MKATVMKLLRWLGKALMFVLIVAGTIFLIAERFHETSFTNFIRSLM